jgi:ABC-type Fe3+-siderophore transport system permease subunit
MDNMLERIYGYVYIGAFIVNGIALLLFNINPDVFTIWITLIVFGIATLIIFLMGRLVQERFDNTLQMYLIIVSIGFLISAFIPYRGYGWLTVLEAGTAILIFGTAFLLDGIFEAD